MDMCAHPARPIRRAARLGRRTLAGLGLTSAVPTNRGCEHCADDHTVIWHLERIASDARRHLVLVRCPSCSSLYEVPSVGRSGIVRISNGQALRWYPAYAASAARAATAPVLESVGPLTTASRAAGLAAPTTPAPPRRHLQLVS